MSSNRVANAAPIKDFFIDMLVRDIPLSRAILDLVDNCVDGAIRLRDSDQSFRGLWVRAQVDDDAFSISDNCGGIPVDVAEHYAFRFGRPEGLKVTDRSLGRFGVGMKRAFFKLGNRFRVESRTESDRFVVEVDVTKWRRDTSPDWHFDFTELEEGQRKKRLRSLRGTDIVVTALHPDVAEEFGLENFRTALREEIESFHEEALQRGLAISVNGIELQAAMPTLKESPELKPAVRSLRIRDVSVRLYAGLGESEPRDAGWSIYCNGRLVVEADQTSATGWGDTVPRMHNQYARFRGYAFFEADDASSLPWDTTKSHIDLGTGVYRRTRQEMMTMMGPVVKFLNELDRAKESGDDRLESAVESAKHVGLRGIQGAEVFHAPTGKLIPRRAETQSVQYEALRSKLDKAKRVLKVQSNRAVGEKTFHYFYQRECED